MSPAVATSLFFSAVLGETDRGCDRLIWPVVASLLLLRARIRKRAECDMRDRTALLIDGAEIELTACACLTEQAGEDGSTLLCRFAMRAADDGQREHQECGTCKPNAVAASASERCHLRQPERLQRYDLT